MTTTTDTCAFCDPKPGETFDPRAQHRECGLRNAVGGIGHLTAHDFWCTVKHDPDAGLSYRDSALAVWDWVQEYGLDSAIWDHA